MQSHDFTDSAANALTRLALQTYPKSEQSRRARRACERDDSASYVNELASAFAQAQGQQQRPSSPADPSDHAGFGSSELHLQILRELNGALVSEPPRAPLTGISPLILPDQNDLAKAVNRYNKGRDSRQKQQALATYREVKRQWQTAGLIPAND
jgi:hypothetical protein